LLHKNNEGTEILCPKWGKNPKLRNFKSRKMINFLYGDLARTTTNEPKMQRNWNSTALPQPLLSFKYEQNN
jgi:hypothetical protein